MRLNSVSNFSSAIPTTIMYMTQIKKEKKEKEKRNPYVKITYVEKTLIFKTGFGSFC